MRRMYTASSNCSLFTKKKEKDCSQNIRMNFDQDALCPGNLHSSRFVFRPHPYCYRLCLGMNAAAAAAGKVTSASEWNQLKKERESDISPAPALSTDQMQPSHLLQAVNGTHSEERERGSFWITRTKSGAGLSSNCEYWLLCVSLAVLAMIRY